MKYSEASFFKQQIVLITQNRKPKANSQWQITNGKQPMANSHTILLTFYMNRILHLVAGR
jgi:hypothetical protein